MNNWPDVIKRLNAHGLTQTEIARRARCSQSLISDLLRGRRGECLSYSIGSALLDLDRELSADFAPARANQCSQAA